MTTIVRRRWHCRMSSNLLGLAAVGIAVVAGCTSEETALQPVDTTAAAITSATSKPAKPPKPATASDAFVEFESGQVRPLALSGDGRFLYAANTPDNRLEIFRVTGRRLHPLASVPVGLEPVALAERRPGELWVVNHLSDSVSIVDVGQPDEAHVVRTLLVGDEPRDIVFAGPHRSRAFITTAHRGQNAGRDPQLTTPGVGRADVWVFDADHLGASLAGTPLTVLTLFADTPRALAVSADGRTVYAAAFHSGNRTTSIHERLVTPNGGLPPPATNAQGAPRPPTALIVKYRTDPQDGQLHWLDETGRRWDDQRRSWAFPTRTCSRSTPARIRRRRSPPACSPASGRCCSTWRSTRSAERSTSRTATRGTTCASRGTTSSGRPRGLPPARSAATSPRAGSP